LAESSKEVYGAKSAVLPMMMKFEFYVYVTDKLRDIGQYMAIADISQTMSVV
jgi:hypothetical protein